MRNISFSQILILLLFCFLVFGDFFRFKKFINFNYNKKNSKKKK